jgi:serine/threonine-protein kinase RsbW
MGDEPRDRLLNRLSGSAPIGLAAFDRHLRYLAVNEWLAAANGASIEAHLGHTVREIAPHHAERLEPLMQEVLDGGEPVYGVPFVAIDPDTGERRTTEVSFFGLDDSQGRRTVLGCVVVDTTSRERALARVRFFQETVTAVASASDSTTAAQTLVNRALEAVGAQGAGIAFATSDTHMQFVAVAGPLGDVLVRDFAQIPIDADAPICAAYRDGTTVWLPTQEEWQRRYPFGAHLVHHGARATFCAPLETTTSGRRLGVLGVAFDHEPDLDTDDLELVIAFTQHAAQALERTLLLDSERALRSRFQVLAALGSRLDEEIEPRARIEAFLDAVVPGFATLAYVDLEQDDDHDAPLRVAREDGLRAPTPIELVTLPLATHNETFGSVTFGRPAFTTGDHALATELGRRLANALENARLYERERKIAETLQQSLLPRFVPQVPGARVWARYLPGTDLVVGGDFWDVIELPCQRLLLVVGDVAGRGERAAIVMGRLRTVIRASTDGDTTPAALLAVLNRFLVDHEDEMATCLCAVFDQTTGALRIANAGHPPLLRLGTDGEASYVGGATGVPIGVRPFTTYGEETFTVEAGETLMLFTDGLVERRDEPIDARLDLLARRTREAVAAGDGWCDRVVDAMIGARRDDDVALLGVRIERLRTPELDIEVPAELAYLRTVRDRIRTWLSARETEAADIEAVLLAVGEATGNAAVHAYGALGGRMRLAASIDGDRLSVSVSDDGTWRPPRDAQGRGLDIIEQLSDEMDVATDDRGTTLTFSRRLAAGTAEKL